MGFTFSTIHRPCFSPTPKKQTSPNSLPHNTFPSSLPDSSVILDRYSCKSFDCLNRQNSNLGFQPSREVSKFTTYNFDLDLPEQLIQIYNFYGVVDIVRCGRAVNQWILVTMLEFLLFDVDRVLRGGGYLWLDKGLDLKKVYKPLIGKLGYRKVKWAIGRGQFCHFNCSNSHRGYFGPFMSHLGESASI